MPTEIRRAYRDPIDLVGLLQSRAYNVKQAVEVRDDLMSLLINKYGDPWVSVGSKEVRVSTRVKQFKVNVASAVEMLSTVEDYGGRDGVMSALAVAMEPRWSEWWQNFEWYDWKSVSEWRDVAWFVLGRRQFLWICAQAARSAIDTADPERRGGYLRIIEIAERFAVSQSKDVRQILIDERSINSAQSGTWAPAQANIDASIMALGRYIVVHNGHASMINIAHAANALAQDAKGIGRRMTRDDAFAYLADMTRKMITPTLITDAVRSSGAVVARSLLPAAAIGAVVGAGAMHFAKRA